MANIEKVVCEYCGAVHATKKENLAPYIVKILPKLYDAGGWCRISEMDLTKSQYACIQKLKYWGLVISMNTEEDAKRRGGWSLTKKGKEFTEGKISLHKHVLVKDTVVLEFGGEEVYIHDIKGCGGFKLRGEYADEIRQQILWDEGV